MTKVSVRTVHKSVVELKPLQGCLVGKQQSGARAGLTQTSSLAVGMVGVGVSLINILSHCFSSVKWGESYLCTGVGA